jgi:hypothetical protein
MMAKNKNKGLKQVRAKRKALKRQRSQRLSQSVAHAKQCSSHTETGREPCLS